MLINNSPDISNLSLSVTWDISGTLPSISLVNLSDGPNLQNLTYWFIANSPSQTLIHEGSQSQPDIIGAWNGYVISDSWPRPFNGLEWSGAAYGLTVFVQDSVGNVYNTSYLAVICRPSGNTNLSKNFYGISNTDVQVQCQQARLYFQDQTNSSYQGLPGTLVSSVLRLVYPIDETGNIPAPFVITNFSSAAAPISYSSDNYQFQTQLVYDYDFGNGIHVRIRYQTINPKNGVSYITFPVLCNIDLSPLVCEYEKLVDSIESGSCVNVQDAERKLMLINPKFAMVVMGLMQPLTGIDVPGLISEIETIGGFTCDCCNAPTGIIPQTSSVIDGYSFQIVPVCGDITGTVQVTGTNVQLLLSDKTYSFVISGSSPTAAFTITPATVGCVKTYSFNVDLVTLSTDLLNTIKTDAGLVNLFNSIVTGGSAGLIAADGKCVYQSSSTFNYTFTLSNIPISTTFAILSQLTVGASVQSLSFLFNLTNLPALQSYLNGLDLGTFVVTNPSGQTVQIASSANSNILSSMVYGISSTNFIATQSSNASGYTPIPANQVIQFIINYLCGLTDGQIITSQDYTISFVGNNGQPQQVVFGKGSTLAAFLAELVSLQGQTVQNIGNNLSVSCDSLKNAFPVSQTPITATDFLYITRGGECSRGNFLDVFNYMLTSGITNATTKAAFCAFVSSCGAGMTCDAYNYFDVMVTNFDTTCAPITGIEYTLS